MKRLRIINPGFLDDYIKCQPISISKHFDRLVNRQPELQPTESWADQSSVYSCLIEGCTIDIDTYLYYDKTGIWEDNQSMQQIKCLKQAYLFASTAELNRENILTAHQILSVPLLNVEYQGVIRDKNVHVRAGDEVIYTGTAVDKLKEEMDKVFDDVDRLSRIDLNINEVFYFASMFHLILAKIHPFADGNGRISRLVEKWFLSSKLGSKAWYISLEKLYQNRLSSYYNNLDIGKDYPSINLQLCMSFLKMLPMALRIR